MRLRRLNKRGVAHFQAYIDGLRKGKDEAPPSELLSSNDYSEDIPWLIILDENRAFETRYAMGDYLTRALEPCDLTLLSLDIGFWSWLALFYFDQLCPWEDGPGRKVREDANYILSLNYLKRMRHAVRTTYIFVNRFGEKVRFLFSAPMDVRGEIIEQISQRQELTNCDEVILAASILYNDPDKLTFKRGATTKNSAGTVHRYIKVLEQFSVTYDLYSVPSAELIELLPSEFERFLRA